MKKQHVKTATLERKLTAQNMQNKAVKIEIRSGHDDEEMRHLTSLLQRLIDNDNRVDSYKNTFCAESVNETK